MMQQDFLIQCGSERRDRKSPCDPKKSQSGEMIHCVICEEGSSAVNLEQIHSLACEGKLSLLSKAP